MKLIYKSSISLFILIFISCNSIKKSYEPINDYLDSVSGKKKIIIVDKKIIDTRTIKILHGSFIFDTQTNSLERIGNKSKIYNQNDFNNLVKEYSKDSIISFWNTKNFRKRKVVIIDEKKFASNELYKYYSAYDELSVYKFSNPISYKNDSICLFTVFLSNTTFSSPFSEFVIVMKKKKNKWVTIDKVWADENHIN